MVRESKGTFFNADYYENRKCCDFHLKKMSRLLFHALGETSRKMLNIVREICVQVRENVRESQETFLFLQKVRESQGTFFKC